MDNEITELFQDIIAQAGSIDMAEAEFKKMIGGNEELHRRYRDYCREVGSTERRGFLDFADDYMDSRESIWDSLNDYDE